MKASWTSKTLRSLRIVHKEFRGASIICVHHSISLSRARLLVCHEGLQQGGGGAKLTRVTKILEPELQRRRPRSLIRIWAILRSQRIAILRSQRIP
jgi:hypothetical protein